MLKPAVEKMGTEPGFRLLLRQPVGPVIRGLVNRFEKIRPGPLPLPPGLVGDLLHGREKILEHRARAEVDLGVDLHAGDEAEIPALALEALADQVDRVQ